MRRAKSKFRPSVGGVQGRVESVPRSPQTNSSPVTPTTPNVPTIAQVDPNEPTIELKAIPDPVEPLAIQASSDNAEKGCVDFLKFQNLLDGQVIEPPDAPESEEDVENALFKFKVPPPEKSLKIPKRKAEKKKKDDALSTSTRSSRSLAIARRKQAEKNLEKGTSEEGNIDRTEVSMEDLIFVGPKIGTHEMGFSKRLREAREAKERATTISQLSGITAGTKKSEKSIMSSDRYTDNTDKVIPKIVQPKVRIVDGKVVVDKSSLLQQMEEQTTEISEEIVEDFEDMPEEINSLSFRTRKHGKRSKNWSDEETDRFYEAITIVGNDIVALSSAFARRDASEIKRKFNRENRQNSHKIDQLLAVHATGESTWDVTHLREKDEEYHVKMDELENEKKRKREERVQRQIQRQENNNGPKPKKRQKKQIEEYRPPPALEIV